MGDWAEQFEADSSKSRSTLLVLFIPSHDRFNRPLHSFGIWDKLLRIFGRATETPQDYWVDKALTVLGTSFEGGTAFPQAKGVWRDDAQEGRLVFDRPVVIQCYTNENDLVRYAKKLRDFLIEMGQETRQGAVAFVIDMDFCVIPFPLTE